MSPQADLEERIERLEELRDRAITIARKTAAGRAILAMLGIT